MRIVLAALAAFAALTAPAFAQESRWRHAGGLWSIDFAGWTQEEAAEGALWNLRLGATADAAVALCLAREEAIPRPADMSDNDIKSYAAQLTAEVMPVPPGQGTLQSVEHPVVDGVTLAAFRVHDMPGATARLDMRMLFFYVPSAASAHRFQIQCVTPMGASQDVDAAIERLAMSIRFAS